MHRIILPVLLFLLINPLFAQHGRTCGTMEALELEIKNNPGRADELERIEQQIARWIEQNENFPQKQTVITIPVVVHIIYNTTAQNISDNQIFSQIEVLNEDFRKLNADASLIPSVWQSVAADVQLEFCLAQRDPNGNPTNGITRTSTSVSSFGTNNNIKFNSSGGKDAWPRDDYLNIWVGNLSGGLLGYAQFPGGGAATDGIVCHYLAFGRIGTLYTNYNKGRTATHEIGHWLNLRHIWGDDGNGCSGTDFVNDTPNQAGNNCCCPTFPLTDACSPSSPGVMFMNYMDYTYDDCMYMFTEGQAQRMLAALNGSRAGLLNSQACVPLLALDAGILNILSPSGSSCNTTINPQVELRNFGSSTLTSVTIHYRLNAGPVNTFNWTGSLAQGNATVVNLPSMTTGAGTHTFTAYTSQPNGGVDGYAGNDSQTLTFTILSAVASQYIPFFQGFDASGFPPAGWTLVNPENNNSWERVTGTSGFGNSSASARMDHYSGAVNISGQSDYLYTPAINLSSETPPLTLEFSVAYARYNSFYYDSLIVLASSDCGISWTRIYAKGNNPGLATAPDQVSGFVPGTMQWRKETINIDSYAGSGNVKFAFQAKSGWGNYCYVDDINIFKQNVLPVEMLSFSGKASDDVIILNWQTATEKDNEKFILEKSKDALNFNFFEELNGHGNSHVVNNYEVTDYNPYVGINYYRLKQKDYDGKITTVGIVSVKFNSHLQNDIIVYPNPDNSGVINIIHSGEVIQEIFITSSDGKKNNLPFTTGSDKISFNHNLSPGVYSITIRAERNIYNRKLIIY